MRVRRAVLDDVDALAAVHVRSWQVGYRGQLPDEVLDGLHAAQRVPRWSATVRDAAWPGRGTLVVADDDGAVLGFADLRPTRDPDRDPATVGEISSFYVDPGTWNRGVGRQLMTAALTALVDGGYVGATLWVLATNARAIRFYTATGWRDDGAVKDDTVAGVAVRDLRYRHDLQR